jgi:hypothetical protein
VTDTPNRQFVRLAHADPKLAGTTMTFLGAAPEASVTADNDGILASIAEKDPPRAARIQAGLAQLIAQNDRVMSWLQADVANTTLFAQDPAAAVHAALPELPADFFEGWQ